MNDQWTHKNKYDKYHKVASVMLYNKKPIDFNKTVYYSC